MNKLDNKTDIIVRSRSNTKKKLAKRMLYSIIFHKFSVDHSQPNTFDVVFITNDLNVKLFDFKKNIVMTYTFENTSFFMKQIINYFNTPIISSIGTNYYKEKLVLVCEYKKISVDLFQKSMLDFVTDYLTYSKNQDLRYYKIKTENSKIIKSKIYFELVNKFDIVNKLNIPEISFKEDFTRTNFLITEQNYYIIDYNSNTLMYILQPIYTLLVSYNEVLEFNTLELYKKGNFDEIFNKLLISYNITFDQNRDLFFYIYLISRLETKNLDIKKNRLKALASSLELFDQYSNL